MTGHTQILSTGAEVITILHSTANSTTVLYLSIAFIWDVTPKDFINSLEKLEPTSQCPTPCLTLGLNVWVKVVWVSITGVSKKI